MSRSLLSTLAVLAFAALSGCSLTPPGRAPSPPPLQPVTERLAFDEELGHGGWDVLTEAAHGPWPGWSPGADSVCDGEFDILIDGAPDALRQAEVTYQRNTALLTLRVIGPIDSPTMGRLTRALLRCDGHSSQRVRNGSVETVTFTTLSEPPPGGMGAVVSVTRENGEVESRRIVFANDGVLLSSAVAPGHERTTLLVITTAGEAAGSRGLESSLIRRFRETDDR